MINKAKQFSLKNFSNILIFSNTLISALRFRYTGCPEKQPKKRKIREKEKLITSVKILLYV